MFTKQSTFTLGLIGLVGLGCLAAQPAQAASFSTTAWLGSGDANLSSDPISLSTDSRDYQDDSPAPTGSFNFSGSNPTEVGFDPGLETFLGLAIGDLDPAGTFASEGSAIKQTFDAQAGDSLQFNWQFLTNEGSDQSLIPFNDYAFLVVNGQKFTLADITNATTPSSVFATNPANAFFKEGNGSYTYNFATAGNYTIGLGVVDVGDFTNTSALQLRNFRYTALPTAIPTPALLPGLVGLGLGLLRKRKSDAAA